ncbi:hypothetical protein C0R09_12955 [Brevibacillus laterosporus]|uniref:metallophosphoesterase n=1 Tax=Brevibacillus laterosporus TaxID=1465 RepID=UPI000C789CFB|nr:metallophosphoesterase [Brevibacillus laterosporus]AUM65358.1 hypothetical protein C0R09_12955 [Brevibacillus laterosporus]
MKKKHETSQKPSFIPPLAARMRYDHTARPGMVNWYNPKQLIVTGIKTLLSTLFGLYSDFRLIEAYGQSAPRFEDYSKAIKQDEQGNYVTDKQGFYCLDESREREEVWIDYVSDLGDGFNSTYTIAYYLSRPTLCLEDTDSNHSHITSRGNILVFGGDQVYPTANKKAYETRLITPYYLAMRYSEHPHPQVFAIPGNHDWYDGLVAFTRLFCSRKWFNGWQAPQQKSYFAIKLPHHWWLLGTDVQLNSDIDGPQIKFFESIAEQMQEGDRVILCNAEPYWVSSSKYGEYDHTYNENNLFFLEKLLKKQIQVFIAGDQHHYRRFEFVPEDSKGNPDHSKKVVKITAGGGGAFLHPTHDFKEQYIKEHFSEQITSKEKRMFKRMKDFPDQQKSRQLCRGNLLFLAKNKTFGIVTSIIYLILAFAVFGVDSPSPPDGSFGDSLVITIYKATHSIQAIFWMLIIVGGFWLFTDTHSRRYKWIAGCIHGLSHITAALLINSGVIFLLRSYLELDWGPGTLALYMLFMAIGGWVIGSSIMGLYLYISLNVFGRHSNEAFSSLKVEDWKNFLRIHIDKEGNLTIYPIGLEKIVTHWNLAPLTDTGPLLKPDVKYPEIRKAVPKLIESPIVIYPRISSK